MTALTTLGVLFVAAGLFGLGFCIRAGFVIRRERPPEDVARARLKRLVAVNLGSVALASLGLALVVVGLTL